MSHTPDCVAQYFGSSQNIKLSYNTVIFTPVASWEFTAQRPFIPLWLLDKSNGLPPLAWANQIAFSAVYTTLFEQIFLASYNYVQGLSGGVTAEYLSGEFGSYLWRTVGNNEPTRYRYDAIGNFARNFWTNVDPAATTQEQNVQMRSLAESLANFAESKLFLPPGHYYFNDGNALELELDAILAADADFYGFQVLELSPLG